MNFEDIKNTGDLQKISKETAWQKFPRSLITVKDKSGKRSGYAFFIMVRNISNFLELGFLGSLKAFQQQSLQFDPTFWGRAPLCEWKKYHAAPDSGPLLHWQQS
jgi:hypothetical protein